MTLPAKLDASFSMFFVLLSYVCCKVNHIILHVCFHVSSHASLCLRVKRVVSRIEAPTFKSLREGGRVRAEKTEEIALILVLGHELEFSRWMKIFGWVTNAKVCRSLKKQAFSILNTFLVSNSFFFAMISFEVLKIFPVSHIWCLFIRLCLQGSGKVL